MWFLMPAPTYCYQMSLPFQLTFDTSRGDAVLAFISTSPSTAFSRCFLVMEVLNFRSSLALLVAMATFANCEFTITTITDGNYTIAVNNVIWLHSAPMFVYTNGKKHSTADGTLRADNAAYATSGIDRLGPWQDMQKILRVEGLVFKNTMKTYQTDQLPLIIFKQTYYNETTKTRSPNANMTISAYPSFGVKDLRDTVGYLSFGGEMMGDVNKKVGRWGPDNLDINDGLNGGPLVLFDKHGNTIIMQAFSNFMSVSMWYDNVTETINWGIMGDVDTIPAGFEISVVLYYNDKGINAAFEDLGSRMRYYYGKTDYYKKLDNTLNYIGYWTDNGAYYYYHTENNDTASYEQTLIDVKSYSDMLKIPYKYMQLDSWWYKKGPLSGVTEWTPLPGIFPDGLKFLHNKIGLPFAAHNRYWSRNAIYAKQNGGKYNFIMGKLISLPDDQAFWDFLFSQAKEWGLTLYEQDWLDAQLLGLEALQNDLTLGQRWLEQMGMAAQKNGQTIQYCMSLPREALQSLTIPTVTQARVSDDYHLLPDQWKIGITSIFAYSMGLAPSKDTFWTTEVQPDNPYERNCNSSVTPGDVSRCFNATEPYPALQTLVAVLSTGPVGPGDMINGTDKALLMKCCNEDGLILKPSKPATAVDDQIIEAAFQDGSGPDGEVWATYTDYDDVYLRFGIIMAANTSSPYIITRQKAGLIPFIDKYQTMIFSAKDTSTVMRFDDQHPFTIPACSLEDDPGFCLYYTSPVLTVGSVDVIIMGDLNKWVPMSPQRVYRIWLTDDAVALTMRGKPGETITVTYAIGNTEQQISKLASSSGCANFLLYKTPTSTFNFPSGLQCSWKIGTTTAPPTPSTMTAKITSPPSSMKTSFEPKATLQKMSTHPTPLNVLIG